MKLAKLDFLNYMKFDDYQYLEGEPVDDFVKKTINSKFWNRGKWDNFILPFLPEDCFKMTFIDMGCNAGLFLKFAQDKGFERIVGVDVNKEAINKGIDWRDKNGGIYKLLCSRVEESIDDLPVADFTVLANIHYYLRMSDWIEYLDKLQFKTRYCIIVTSKGKRSTPNQPSTNIAKIRSYFRNWKEIGTVDNISEKGDPFPRQLFSICFESHCIEKIPVEAITYFNRALINFYKEIDEGVNYEDTYDYKYVRDSHKWLEKEQLGKIFLGKIALYEDIKKNGLKKAILIGSLTDNMNIIDDGEHRYRIIAHLGYKNIFIRRV